MEKSSLLERYQHLEVGELIQALEPKAQANLDKLKIEISRTRSDWDKDQLERWDKMITRAEKRINEPLEPSLRMQFFFNPFGMMGAAYYQKEVERFTERGFLRKRREFILFSVVGLAFYFMLLNIIRYLFLNQTES
ncbi:MAG: hypothetical protein AAFX87_05045 [Bacteroidota bacterium]